MLPSDQSADFQKLHALETYKGLQQIGIEGIKLVFLANGGAAVAILAFLGNSASKGKGYPDLTNAMVLFTTGIALTCFAMLLAYVMQLRLHTENISGAKERHGAMLWAAIILMFVSVMMFVSGSLASVHSFMAFQRSMTT